MTSLIAFDLLLALSLVGFATGVLLARDHFTAIVLFIVLGLLMAVVWCRLRAVDIALAEGAIGAGLTGALLLTAVAREPRRAVPTAARNVSASRLLTAATAVVLMMTLALVILQRPTAGDVTMNAVRAHLPLSGVTNPVTAVLLNFRSYDTLLEVGVLLLAVLGTWAVASVHPPPASSVPTEPADRSLLTLTRILSPVLLVVAVWLLWRGSKAPGGAFQAGAVLCGGVVLMLVARVLPVPQRRRLPLRVALVVGFLGFLLAGLGMMVTGQRFLQYPPAYAGAAILGIEVLLTISIAATLAVLFAAVSGGKSPHTDSITPPGSLP